MAVYRGSSDVLLNFQGNVRLMTELKHLNAFVRDTVSVAEKELSESVYRKKRGNCYYSYNRSLVLIVVCVKIFIPHNDHHGRKKLYGSSCVDIKKILAK